MTRFLRNAAMALAICAGAHAATVSTTLTVNAKATINVSTGALSATGTANLTGIGSGTITSTVPLSFGTGSTIAAPFTITLTGGTLVGTLQVPTSFLSGATSGTGSGTITSGTGTYATYTGTFPSLAGTVSGDLVNGLTIAFTGAGTVNTSSTPTPTVTDVLDAASYTKTIAQGSIFVVKGTAMSASGFTQFSFPLPATSAGVKITFTPAAGGAGTDAFLVYLYNQGGVNQLAAVLPSTLATGTYNVTVTNNGTVSAPFSVQVVQRKIGLITQDSSGTGLAVVQNFISQSQLDVDRYTTGSIGGFTISPAKPGQFLIAWATGMGPVTGGDNTASPGFDFAANGVTVRVIVGGVSITPAYAGRAPGLAGADQINFALPASVPTGCTVSFQVSVNGVLSNPSFIAIAPSAGASECVAPGFTADQLKKFDQGGSYTIGTFGLTQISETVPTYGNIKLNTASGGFFKYTGFQLAGAAQTQGVITDSCQVIHSTGSSSTVVTGTPVGLDAGNVTLNGPAASSITNLAFKEDPTSFAYSLALASEGLPTIPGVTAGVGTIVAGTYRVAGAGGKDVGAFNAQITLGSPLTITGGLPSTVNRAAGLTLNWTGGNSGDLVEIIGSSSTTTGSGTNLVSDAWLFICTTTAGKGTFTVPSSVLVQLPAVSASSTTGSGFLEVASGPLPAAGNGLFSAPLTAGGSIDFGAFIALIAVGGAASYQ